MLELNCTSRWSSGYWLVVWNLHDQTEARSIHSPVHHIQTCSSMLAGWTVTLIEVQLTVNALVSRHTLTGVQTHVIVTGGAVLTGIRLTFININFTVHSCRTNQHTDSLTEETSPLKTTAASMMSVLNALLYLCGMVIFKVQWYMNMVTLPGYILHYIAKSIGSPLLMNRFDYFSNFYEYKS